MSYDEKLGYNPEKPVRVEWEGQNHPEIANTDEIELADGGVWFREWSGERHAPDLNPAPQATFVPMHRINAIKFFGSKGAVDRVRREVVEG